MKSKIQAVGMVFFLGAVGCGGGDGGKTGDFSSFIKDRIPKVPLSEMTAVALDNTTAKPLAGVADQVSDASGMVYFEGLPGDAKGKVGFLIKAKDKWIDTYQFNIDVTAQDEELWALDKWTYDNAPGMGGLVVKPELGLLAGAFYYVNDAGQEEPVGCATAEIMVGTQKVSDDEIRYFNNGGLPTKLRPAGSTDTTARNDSNPKNGLFTAANLFTGSATIKMKVGEQVVGTETTVIIKESATKDALLITNVYVDKTISPTNPTPAGCL